MTVLGRNTTITILRPVRTPDDIGDLGEQYNTVIEGLAARIEPEDTGQSTMNRDAQGRIAITDYWCLLDGDESDLVFPNDVVLDEGSGLQYEVIDVHLLGLRTTRIHHTEVELRKVKATRQAAQVPLTSTP